MVTASVLESRWAPRTTANAMNRYLIDTESSVVGAQMMLLFPIAPHPITLEPNPIAHAVLDGYLLETQPLKHRPTEEAGLGGPVTV